MSGSFLASTGGLIIRRDDGGRLPIHDVPNGLESEFNGVSERSAAAVAVLLKLFESHNVECDPRNRAVLLRNLREMGIRGDAIVTALNSVCGGDTAMLAEQIFSLSPALAQSVHAATGRATFAKGEAFHEPFNQIAGPPGGWR